jgi:hypothetical protein
MTAARYLERGECPPVMIDYFASAGPWPPAELDIISLVRRIPTPGDRLVNLGHEFEWFVDLDVWIENPRDGVATPGSATVYLPSHTS